MPPSLDNRIEYYREYYKNAKNLWQKQERQRKCYWADEERRKRKILQMKEYRNRNKITNRTVTLTLVEPKRYSDSPVKISHEPIILSFE